MSAVVSAISAVSGGTTTVIDDHIISFETGGDYFVECIINKVVGGIEYLLI